mgnify:CR=1 FL=1
MNESKYSGPQFTRDNAVGMTGDKGQFNFINDVLNNNHINFNVNKEDKNK